MIWYMMWIHLSRKLAPSFLPNTLDKNITMIWKLFINLEVFHSVDVDLALNCPSDYHPFIIVRKSTNSFFCFSHSRVTLIWDSLKWYIWLKTDALKLATLSFSKFRIALFSWSIFHVIHSITSRHGNTGHPSLTCLTPSQTHGTEISQKLVLEPTSQQTYSN